MTAADLVPADLGARYIAPRDSRPTLFAVVDTEEDFEWHAPFSRENVSVGSMRQAGRGQAVLDRYNVRPTYVVDYPVATQPDGYAALLDIWKAGACSIGAHLHPWVTPPFEETVSRPNSYACNLPPDLERRKIASIAEAIAERFDRPTVYKAGRYGFGRFTGAALEDLGFEVDLSINPTLARSDDGGPSFEAFDSRPFFFGARNLLELPCTHGYSGWSGPLRQPLHRLASGRFPQALRAVGVLARIGAVNRVMLSPEGNTLAEMIALTRTLHREGLRAFTMTFHSSSLEPGHTPYVRSQADLDALLDRIRAYCDFFFGDLGGTTSTPMAYRKACLASLETEP